MGMLATQQLTEFLSVVADRPDGPAAQYAAVECAARALDADVAVLVIDGLVVASIGVPAEQLRPAVLHDVATGRHTTLHLAGTALHPVDLLVLLLAGVVYMLVLGTTYPRGLVVAAIQYVLTLLLVIALASTFVGPALRHALR